MINGRGQTTVLVPSDKRPPDKTDLLLGNSSCLTQQPSDKSGGWLRPIHPLHSHFSTLSFHPVCQSVSFSEVNSEGAWTLCHVREERTKANTFLGFRGRGFQSCAFY